MDPASKEKLMKDDESMEKHFLKETDLEEITFTVDENLHQIVI